MMLKRHLNHLNLFIQEVEILMTDHHNLGWIYESEVIIWEITGGVLWNFFVPIVTSASLSNNWRSSFPLKLYNHRLLSRKFDQNLTLKCRSLTERHTEQMCALLPCHEDPTHCDWYSRHLLILLFSVLLAKPLGHVKGLGLNLSIRVRVGR